MTITPELEKVARAICEAEMEAPSDDFEWRAWIPNARAALQALLPVGEGVVEAMEDQITTDYPGLVKAECRAAFTAAINHITKDQG